MPRVLMLDWETLDTEPTAKVIAVGAVTFELGNPDAETQEFYTRIGTATQQNRTESQSTLDWWEKQDPIAQEHSFKGHRSGDLPDLETVTLALRNFVTATHAEYIMGNGNMFDCNIFRDICGRANVPYPVSYWADLDLRTAKLMSKGDKLPWPEDLVPHHALDDAKYQVLCIQSWWEKLHAKD